LIFDLSKDQEERFSNFIKGNGREEKELASFSNEKQEIQCYGF
jgi:hypothetical protein